MQRRSRALQLARSAQLNPHELVYLGGAYARFGDTASSLNVLHSMVDGGRLPGRLFLTLVAPSLRNAKGWQKLLDAYDTEEKRRRRLYGAS